MAQQILPTTRYIGDILNLPWTATQTEHVFTVFAQVAGIYHDSGWFYGTCYQCSKSLVVRGGLFFCNICDKPCRYPVLRYRIHVNVRDQTGESTFTIFNEVAERLLDSAANKFVRQLRIGSVEFPPQIATLTGRFYAFTIKLPDLFNEDYDYHNLRVVGIYEVHPIPKIMAHRLLPDEAKKEHKAGATLSLDTAYSICKGECGPEVSTPAKKPGGRCVLGPSHEGFLRSMGGFWKVKSQGLL